MHYSQVGNEMLIIRDMDEDSAQAISLWNFGEAYAHYNLNGEQSAIQEFLHGHYYVVYKDDDIFGFFVTVIAPKSILCRQICMR